MEAIDNEGRSEHLRRREHESHLARRAALGVAVALGHVAAVVDGEHVINHAGAASDDVQHGISEGQAEGSMDVDSDDGTSDRSLHDIVIDSARGGGSNGGGSGSNLSEAGSDQRGDGGDGGMGDGSNHENEVSMSDASGGVDSSSNDGAIGEASDGAGSSSSNANGGGDGGASRDGEGSSNDGGIGNEAAGSNGGDVGAKKKRKRAKQLPWGKRQAMKKHEQQQSEHG